MVRFWNQKSLNRQTLVFLAVHRPRIDRSCCKIVTLNMQYITSFCAICFASYVNRYECIPTQRSRYFNTCAIFWYACLRQSSKRVVVHAARSVRAVCGVYVDGQGPRLGVHVDKLLWLCLRFEYREDFSFSPKTQASMHALLLYWCTCNSRVASVVHSVSRHRGRPSMAAPGWFHKTHCFVVLWENH